MALRAACSGIANTRLHTSIRDLLSDNRYTDAVMAFLEATRVGEVKVVQLLLGLKLKLTTSWRKGPAV